MPDTPIQLRNETAEDARARVWLGRAGCLYATKPDYLWALRTALRDWLNVVDNEVARMEAQLAREVEEQED